MMNRDKYVWGAEDLELDITKRDGLEVPESTPLDAAEGKDFFLVVSYDEDTHWEGMPAEDDEEDGGDEDLETELEKQDIPLSVKAIIRDDEGRVLIVRDSKRFSSWELPGGHVDSSESPTEALSRELKEETGLDAFDVAEFDLSGDIRRGKDDHPVLVYTCKVAGGTVKLSSEHNMFRWIGPEDKEDLGDLAGVVKDYFRRGQSLSKQQPPGPPPRPGLEWKPSTHRWIRPEQLSQALEDSVNAWVEGTEDLDSLAGALEQFHLDQQTFKMVLSQALKLKNKAAEEVAVALSEQARGFRTYLERSFPQFVTKDFKGVDLAKDLSVYSQELHDDLLSAEALYQNGKIYVNTNRRQERDLLKEEALPKRTLLGAVVHEFGHHVFVSLLSNAQREKWDTLYKKIHKMSNMGNGYLLTGPTYYSLSSYREFFAEVFMLAHLDRGNNYFEDHPDVAALLSEDKLW